MLETNQSTRLHYPDQKKARIGEEKEQLLESRIKEDAALVGLFQQLLNLRELIKSLMGEEQRTSLSNSLLIATLHQTLQKNSMTDVTEDSWSWLLSI